MKIGKGKKGGTFSVNMNPPSYEDQIHDQVQRLSQITADTTASEVHRMVEKLDQLLTIEQSPELFKDPELVKSLKKILRDMKEANFEADYLCSQYKQMMARTKTAMKWKGGQCDHANKYGLDNRCLWTVVSGVTSDMHGARKGMQNLHYEIQDLRLKYNRTEKLKNMLIQVVILFLVFLFVYWAFLIIYKAFVHK